MEPKPGVKTSEYKVEWLSTAISLVVVLLPVIMEIIDKGSMVYVVLACVYAAALKLGSMGYAKSRAIVKAAASQASTPDPQ